MMQGRRLLRERALTCAGTVVAVAASLLLGRDLASNLLERLRTGSPPAVLEQLVFIAIAASLIWGNLVYQVARLGYLRRLGQREQLSAAELEAVYDETLAPPVVLLVPSYREAPRLVRQTLLSAA